MKIVLTLSAIVAASLVGVVANADTERNYSSSECEGYTSTDAALIVRANEGCYYNSTDDCTGPDSITVLLPISGQQSTTETFTGMKLNYALPANQIMTCYERTDYLSGGTLATHTSAIKTVTAPASPSFSYGSITWSSTDLPNSGSSMSNILTQHMVCSVYASSRFLDASCTHYGNKSWILGYQVTTSGL